MLGNRLDAILRNGHDGQTLGIPIGPDTSLLIAELLLTPIDMWLQAKFDGRGHRFYDDYEIVCRTYTEAEETIADLERSLAEYELTLNPRKTAIRPLPVEIEAVWVRDLRRFEIRTTDKRVETNDIISFFSAMIFYSREYPDAAVYKYGIGRLGNTANVIGIESWEPFQRLLLEGALTHPDTVPHTVEVLIKYHCAAYPLDYNLIREVFDELMNTHSTLHHGNEVAWALWLAIVLELPIDDGTANRIGNLDDPIVALLALDAQRQKLVSASVPFERWSGLMNADELQGPMWLMVYEAARLGWPSRAVKSVINQDKFFGDLIKSQVAFYDPDVRQYYKTLGSTTTPVLAVDNSVGY